jgi:hypothetical protein
MPQFYCIIKNKEVLRTAFVYKVNNFLNNEV